MEVKNKIDFLKIDRLKIWNKILLVVVGFGIFFAINNVNIFDHLSPFGIAFAMSLIWCGYNALIVGVEYATTYYLSNMSNESIYISLVVLVIALIIFIINKFKRINYRFGLDYYILTCMLIPFVVFNLSDAKGNATCCIATIFCFAFYYICKYFLKGTIQRGFCARLNPDEKICGCIILAILAYGLIAVEYFSIEFCTIFCAFITLLASYTLGTLSSVVISFALGLGASLATFDPIYISFFICFGLFGSAFISKTRIFSAISSIVVYIFFSLYFTEFLIFKWQTLVALLVVMIIFVLLPNKLIYRLKEYFAGSRNNVAARNVVKSSKDKIVNKLMDISKVFKEMEFSFKRTLQKTLPIEDKKDLIKQDIVDRVCKDCPNVTKCLRINGEYTAQVFDSLVDSGITKGSVSQIDLNSYLDTRCLRIPYLLATTNDIIKAYREYNILSNNMDCSKILVAEQFSGVSNVMKNLAQEVGKDINFDIELENRIMEDLLYKNIICEEAIVFEKNLFEKNIILLVRNSKLSNVTIEKVVSKACKNTIKIQSIEPSELPNISVIYMMSSPNFDVAFGCATCNKTGTVISGDTHSFIKIDNGKYMLALSDGMGSGSKARETSDLAISLIENYYKAGFDNSLILSSVNKLLSLNNEESFSAIDLCIMDFFANTMDFIKLGTPNSYIKRKTGVELIESSGLPIGILEEIRPHITKKYINNFDTIILVSDGIADAFGRYDLKQFINNLNLINPQQIANAIIDKAVAISRNVCEDDMTVLVARIFPTK